MIRQLVTSLAIFALLTGCSPPDPANSSSTQNAASTPQQTYAWKLITSWPKNLPALGTAPEYLAELVEKMTNGRMTIRVYGANELVGGFEVFDAVSRGTAEMGHTGSYYWQGKIPAAVFFSSIPFGLTAVEMNAWLAFGGGNELWQELYAPFNLLPVRAGNSGTQMFGWFNKEINTLADLQGLKMRIAGIGGEVFRRAGGIPVTLQVSDIFTSLGTGAIDATEWISPYNDLAAGFHTLAKYYYYPGWHEPGSTLETIFNKSKFEALPTDLQEILLAATEVTNQRVLDELTAKNNQALLELVNVHNVQLRKIPDEVLLEFRRLSHEVLIELAGQNEDFKRVYESYKQFQENVEAYHLISEEAFIKARRLKAP